MSPTRELQPSMEARKDTPVLRRQSAEDWTFVNLSEPKQSKDKNLRQFVRSNAMRDYRQKKKLDKTRNRSRPGDIAAAHAVTPPPPSPESTLPTLGQNHGDGDSFKYCGHPECVYDCRYSPRRGRSSPRQLLGDGDVDPFDTLPISGDSRYHAYILNHCELPLHLPTNASVTALWVQLLTLT